MSVNFSFVSFPSRSRDIIWLELRGDRNRIREMRLLAVIKMHVEIANFPTKKKYSLHLEIIRDSDA